MSRTKRFRANIIVWGMPKHLGTLEIRCKLANIGLDSFVRGDVRREGDHVRLVLTHKDSQKVDKALVSQVSASLRKIGCRCVLVEPEHFCKSNVSRIDCTNRFESLACQDDYSCVTDRAIDVQLVDNEVNVVDKKVRSLRVATWNFSGLCSERKQKEVRELLVKNNIDVLAGQESWEREDTRINVEGYKWFGKPRGKQNSRRGEGGVVFLVRECLVN